VTTPDDPNFIPPDPNEPIPPPAGATDAGLGGVLVTDTDEIDTAMERLAVVLADVAFEQLAGMEGAPTWDQVYRLAKAMLAKWAPGRRGENVNDLTFWYYGTWSIAAAFCFIGISYLLAHALAKHPTAAQQLAGLQLIAGKKAFVPYIRQIPGYEAEHSGMRVGAIVAVGGFEHIGICVGVAGSTFLLWSCNSTDGDSDDAITIKTYPLSAANGHVNLRYSPTAPDQEDDMPDYVSLGQKKPQQVKAGQAAHAVFDVEYSDKGTAHADGPHPGVLSGGKAGAQFVIEIDASGTAGGSYRLVETDPEKDYAVTKTYPMNKPTYVGLCDAGRHLYVELHPAADGDANVAVKAQYWHR
jgi:hypothetical protein